MTSNIQTLNWINWSLINRSWYWNDDGLVSEFLAKRCFGFKRHCLPGSLLQHGNYRFFSVSKKKTVAAENQNHAIYEHSHNRLTPDKQRCAITTKHLHQTTLSRGPNYMSQFVLINAKRLNRIKHLSSRQKKRRTSVNDHLRSSDAHTSPR